MAKALNKKLEYKIDGRIADGLYEIKDQLKVGKSSFSHRHVAGLCLLGEKDGIVDEFVPMLSDKGCWDSPEINHAQFYKAFTKMIKKDRRVIGMAIIKPENLGEAIVPDIKRNIWEWRKTFQDISQTIWIVVSDDNIIPYRPYKNERGVINIRKSTAKVWINRDESAIMKMAEGKELVKKVCDYDERKKLTMIMSRVSKNVKNGSSKRIKERNVEILDKEIERQKKTVEERAIRQKELQKQREEERKKRYEEEVKKEEERTKYMTPVGNGLFLIKTSDGKEILWRET